ncbi:MAG: tetratricopeptide repeat protein [Proteobacteria bacterium]|nr:tetratricopeptide repeat protein [Pseudomonadota bacterium]
MAALSQFTSFNFTGALKDAGIQGDGVNIAARLEGMAEPGGICISGKVYEEVLDLAFHALRLDPDDYRAHMTLGRLYSYQGKHAKGRAEFDRALRINPNDANVLAISADALVYCERVDEALERCQRAIRLNPNAPDWYWWTLGFSYFHLGRYEEALEALERITALGQARRLLAATYAHLDRLDEARSEAEEFMKITPNFSIKEWARTEPYTDPNELKRYVDGMRKAGLPE